MERHNMTGLKPISPSPFVAEILDDLARAHRILEMEDHGDMSMGHLSFRDPEGRGAWLKRGNLGFEVFVRNSCRHVRYPLREDLMADDDSVGVIILRAGNDFGSS
jgi:hypothetical protein